jgi:hypothetical protein
VNLDPPGHVRWRRAVVGAIVVLQLALVVRGYHSAHREFAFQMFPEASRWQAHIVRVTVDGRRVPVTEPWFGYRWPELVRGRGLDHPEREHHADAGVDNQLAFLAAALDWVASNTPRDRETRYLEARVMYRYNDDPPRVDVMRSKERRL